MPVTVKIVDRYDEIENQKLSSRENKEFMDKTNKMIMDINRAYQNMLNNLYESDIIDTDAEMKVFNAMLKSDGYGTDDISIKEDK